MKDDHKEQLPQDKDRHLDIPQEANQDKHINFLDIEDGNAGDDGNRHNDRETEERQRQWREGIEEGKRARNSD